MTVKPASVCAHCGAAVRIRPSGYRPKFCDKRCAVRHRDQSPPLVVIDIRDTAEPGDQARCVHCRYVLSLAAVDELSDGTVIYGWRQRGGAYSTACPTRANGVLHQPNRDTVRRRP